MSDILLLEEYLSRGFVLRKLTQEEYNVKQYSASD